MLASETLVQIHENGTSIPINNLSIGDLIYDGFLGRYREIIDIKSRAVCLRTHPEFAPITIHNGVLGQDIPSADVLVSPHQEILWVDRSDSAIPVLEPLTANELNTPVSVDRFRTLGKVKYFALFFDEPCYVICSGLTAFAMSPTVFTMPVSQLRRRA